jgi:hypothetical protein
MSGMVTSTKEAISVIETITEEVRAVFERTLKNGPALAITGSHHQSSQATGVDIRTGADLRGDGECFICGEAICRVNVWRSGCYVAQSLARGNAPRCLGSFVERNCSSPHSSGFASQSVGRATARRD